MSLFLPSKTEEVVLKCSLVPHVTLSIRADSCSWQYTCFNTRGFVCTKLSVPGLCNDVTLVA